MNSLVITEKPSQARNVQKAVGNRYGQVLPAQGHLLRLQAPEEVNSAWKQWSAVLLKPETGRYGLVADRSHGKGDRLDKIRRALMIADQVIIATDCDREGQAIGENLIRFFKFKGRVLRAMFTAEDEATLQTAFQAAKSNTVHSTLYDAAVARAQADQIFNLSLTRTATTRLAPPHAKRVIGIGRVRTPTLGIVCRREQELAEFVSRDFFELAANIDRPSGTFRLFHRPAADKRYFERRRAEELQIALTGFTGAISVKTEKKHQAPGKPVDLPTLQKQAAHWGWTAKKTLQIAQALYETAKVTTYPRAATRYLPESMIESAKVVFEALIDGGHAGQVSWSQPKIRTGKKGVFCDAGLEGESHHGIIPNPAMSGQFDQLIRGLTEDERRLFDFIAASFLAALGPDHVYDRTDITLKAAQNGSEAMFGVSGRQTLDPGWKAVFGSYEDKDPNDETMTELPSVEDGETVKIGSISIETKKTAPPPRYSEGSLIQAMQNAWRFVESEVERARLKEAKGIGTPATRDGIIEGLKRQDLLTVQKGKLFASEAAMELYRLLMKNCPGLLDPGATARMESRLDDIVRGEANSETVINEICDTAQNAISILAASEQQLNIRRQSTPGMIKAAKSKAKREGRTLSRGDLADHDKLRAFLGPLPDRKCAQATPSQAQLDLATKISDRIGKPVPAEASASVKNLSAWIEANNVASPAQMKWVKKFVDEKKVSAPKGYPDKVSPLAAKAILDKMFKKKK